MFSIMLNDAKRVEMNVSTFPQFGLRPLTKIMWLQTYNVCFTKQKINSQAFEQHSSGKKLHTLYSL